MRRGRGGRRARVRGQTKVNADFALLAAAERARPSSNRRSFLLLLGSGRSAVSQRRQFLLSALSE